MPNQKATIRKLTAARNLKPHTYSHICVKQNQKTGCNRFLFHPCTHVTGRHIDIVLLQRLLHYYRQPIILHFTYEHAHSVSHRPVALSKRPQPPLSKIELTGKGFFYYTVDILLLLALGSKGATKMNTKCSREITSSETLSKQDQTLCGGQISVKYAQK